MKKKVLLPLIVLLAVGLTGCGGETSSSSEETSSTVEEETSSSSATELTGNDLIIYNALYSLRNNSHQAVVELDASVYRVSSAESDIQLLTHSTFGFRDVSGDRGFSEAVTSESWDLEKDDDHTRKDSSYNTYTYTPSLCFEVDGYARSESLNVSNSVSYSWLSDYDSYTGYYEPLSFANNFSNPWNYIEESDLSVNPNNTSELYLAVNKAEYLADRYDAGSLNNVQTCVIELNDEGQISTLTFNAPDRTTDTYTRVSYCTVYYSEWGNDDVVTHATPYTNENPDLEEAFGKLESASNYTYTKAITYTDSDGDEEYSTTTGFFDEKGGNVFFHRNIAEYPDSYYTVGDDYDYKVVQDPDDGIWYGYQMAYVSGDSSAGTDKWGWSAVYVSTSQQLYYDTFQEIGPTIYQIDTALFTQTGDHEYTVVSDILAESGTYADYGFDGAHSTYLETTTDYLTITLDDDNNIESIKTGFDLPLEQYDFVFTLTDVGTTTMPAYFD